MSFFTNYDYNIKLFLISKEVKIWAEKINIHTKELYKLHKELSTDIEFLLHHSAFYYNKHYARASILKERNKVYLLQKNIETTRSSNKLDHVKFRSFKIIRNIKEVSFKLKLSEDMQ